MKKQFLHIGQQSVYNYDPWEKGTHKRNPTNTTKMKYLILVGREDPKSLEVLMRWKYRSEFRKAKEARICKAEYETRELYWEKASEICKRPLLSLPLNTNLHIDRGKFHEAKKITIVRKL